MQFTKEESKQLNKNKTKIINWIKTEIIPKMQPLDEIIINFGETRHAMDYNATTTEYHLAIYEQPKQFFSTYSNAKGSYRQIAFGNAFLKAKDNFEKHISDANIFALINNWTGIKTEIYQQLGALEHNRNTIVTFEP